MSGDRAELLSHLASVIEAGIGAPAHFAALQERLKAEGGARFYKAPRDEGGATWSCHMQELSARGRSRREAIANWAHAARRALLREGAV